MGDTEVRNLVCTRIVEPSLKDHAIGHKNMVSHSRHKTGGLNLGDSFNYDIEMWDLLPGICGLLIQVFSHGSGLSRQISHTLLDA